MFKRLFFVFCLFTVLLQTGCTSKFAYNNIDWMLYWYVDDYVDLDKSQKKRLDVKVEKWLRWHRQEELLNYRQHLSDLKSDIQKDNLTSQQWLLHLDRGSAHWERFRSEISPELAELSVHLTEQQVKDMFAVLEKENQKEEKKRNDKTAQERKEKTISRSLDQVEEWLGKLSETQKKLIREYSSQYESTFGDWMVYRRKMQSEIQSLMLSRNDVIGYADKFNQLLQNPEQFKSLEYVQVSEYNRIKNAELLATLQTTLTEKQIKHMVNELDDLLDDIDDLIAD